MEAQSKSFHSNASTIFFFLKGCIPYFLISILCGGLVSLFDMINPKIISFTVDSVIGTKVPELSPLVARIVERAGGLTALRAHPAILALAVASMGLCSALFRYLFRTFNVRGGERFVERMRNELFDHILHLPFAWFSDNSTGDIIQRCTSDVQTIKRFVSDQLTQLVRTVIMIFMALYFMTTIDWRIALAAGMFIPVVLSYSLFFHLKIAKSFQQADEEEGKLSAIAQENLTGVRVVRAFGRELYERERFEKQNHYYTGFWVHLMKLMSAYWATGDIMSGAQTLTVAVLGILFCVRGDMLAGDFIAIVSYNLMLTWPVRGLGRVISEMSKAGVSIERIRYIMESPVEADRPDAVEPPMDQDITFDHVSFAYENGGRKILEDITFTIPAGSTVGILGGTGSGKSTLGYLLDRLYDLPEDGGKITVGGVDIADMKAAHLRKNIGYVLQEPFLFSRKLSENIAITEETPDMDRVRRAARIASIDDAIQSFTAGYDTFVGERGVTLSGGQKQRTAIAQTLIRECPIMVFDDSLSAVDAETDMKIRHAMKEGTGKATVILIAHRITTLMNADQIIVLDKGRIRERGTHAELLAQNGLYKKIYDLQLAGADV